MYALWRDPEGRWRAAPGARAVLAVSGDPDAEVLEALEGRAPCFRRFAEARDRLLGVLGDGGGAPPAPPSGGADPGGGDAARGGGDRGQVVRLAARRAPPRRRCHPAFGIGRVIRRPLAASPGRAGGRPRRLRGPGRSG
jgi:hypothetical protein